MIRPLAVLFAPRDVGGVSMAMGLPAALRGEKSCWRAVCFRGVMQVFGATGFCKGALALALAVAVAVFDRSMWLDTLEVAGLVDSVSGMESVDTLDCDDSIRGAALVVLETDS